jgi:hypothetical protein
MSSPRDDSVAGQARDLMLHHHGQVLGQQWLLCPASLGGASHVRSLLRCPLASGDELIDEHP